MGKLIKKASTNWSNRQKTNTKNTAHLRTLEEHTSLERSFKIDVLNLSIHNEKIGYLFNIKPISNLLLQNNDDSNIKHPLSGVILYFLDEETSRIFCLVDYYSIRPYFLIGMDENLLYDYDEFKKILFNKYGTTCGLSDVEIVDKLQLEKPGHLSPETIDKTYPFIKVSFYDMEGLTRAKREMLEIIENNRLKNTSNKHDLNFISNPMDSIAAVYEHDVGIVNRYCIDQGIRCSKWYNLKHISNVKNSSFPHSSVQLLNDEDKYFYEINILQDKLDKPKRFPIIAYDIETTKEPLKFPNSDIDQVMMISALSGNGSGYLFINREIVSSDIADFEYTPKPEFIGQFETFNCLDERETISCFFKICRFINPIIITTFNGDFFDFPFIQRRCEILGLSMYKEIGIRLTSTSATEGRMNAIQSDQSNSIFTGKWILHLDCFAWVCRDSYLPQGSHGLKAVTRAKLKYDPVELDPEKMLPFAKEKPDELAAYSVSDAVATYYLYMKYIHDFVSALSMIIPANGDDVLRKGSGTLCELLLMAEATKNSVLYPNKHRSNKLAYHDSRLIENSTYEGGRVECLRTGVFRADFPETFSIDISAVKDLINSVEETCQFFLQTEEGVQDLSTVENFDEVCASIKSQLNALIEGGGDMGLKVVKKEPFIYHLDVGAMYPNIILSNRLQPTAIIDPKKQCVHCAYDPVKDNCARKLPWKWRGDLFMATKGDVEQLRVQLNAPHQKFKKQNNNDKNAPPEYAPFKDLSTDEQEDLLIKNVRNLSLKQYKRIKSSVYENREGVVCQREHPFYIDTVRAFRDRRYEFKAKTKEWKDALDNATNDSDKTRAKDFVLLYDSLQLAHKCILNSFYGYVMRKGARWYSMTMAGIVTFTGSNLIREAREFVDRVGLPLELDTDGIWCMLPKHFPDYFDFIIKKGESISKKRMYYPCAVLNIRVHEKYTNHQYQTATRDIQVNQSMDQSQDSLNFGESAVVPKSFHYETHSENSIFFEIDGPYKAMILPASTDEDRMLKKRYAIYNFDNSLAELKGFEIKRRGELRLIQLFQEEVFPVFLKGIDRISVYEEVSRVASRWLSIVDSEGSGLTKDEIIELISEKKNMNKSLTECEGQKSSSITCAKRIGEFLNTSMETSAGTSCHLIIGKYPVGSSASERVIPVLIFNETNRDLRLKYLRKWCGDPNLTNDSIEYIVDWSYYRERLEKAILKLIVIPCLNQDLPNPLSQLVTVPPWLAKRVSAKLDRFKQVSMDVMCRSWQMTNPSKPSPQIKNIQKEPIDFQSMIFKLKTTPLPQLMSRNTDLRKRTNRNFTKPILMNDNTLENSVFCTGDVYNLTIQNQSIIHLDKVGYKMKNISKHIFHYKCPQIIQLPSNISLNIPRENIKPIIDSNNCIYTSSVSLDKYHHLHSFLQIVDLPTSIIVSKDMRPKNENIYTLLKGGYISRVNKEIRCSTLYPLNYFFQQNNSSTSNHVFVTMFPIEIKNRLSILLYIHNIPRSIDDPIKIAEFNTSESSSLVGLTSDDKDYLHVKVKHHQNNINCINNYIKKISDFLNSLLSYSLFIIDTKQNVDGEISNMELFQKEFLKTNISPFSQIYINLSYKSIYSNTSKKLKTKQIESILNSLHEGYFLSVYYDINLTLICDVLFHQCTMDINGINSISNLYNYVLSVLFERSCSTYHYFNTKSSLRDITFDLLNYQFGVFDEVRQTNSQNTVDMLLNDCDFINTIQEENVKENFTRYHAYSVPGTYRSVCLSFNICLIAAVLSSLNTSNNSSSNDLSPALIKAILPDFILKVLKGHYTGEKLSIFSQVKTAIIHHLVPFIFDQSQETFNPNLANFIQGISGQWVQEFADYLKSYGISIIYIDWYKLIISLDNFIFLKSSNQIQEGLDFFNRIPINSHTKWSFLSLKIKSILGGVLWVNPENFCTILIDENIENTTLSTRTICSLQVIDSFNQSISPDDIYHLFTTYLEYPFLKNTNSEIHNVNELLTEFLKFYNKWKLKVIDILYDLHYNHQAETTGNSINELSNEQVFVYLIYILFQKEGNTLFASQVDMEGFRLNLKNALSSMHLDIKYLRLENSTKSNNCQNYDLFINIGCPHCSGFMRKINLLEEYNVEENIIICTQCKSDITDTVEYRIFTLLSQIQCGTSQFPFKCKKCASVKTRLLAKYCYCSGEFINWGRVEDLQSLLRNIRIFAARFNMQLILLKANELYHSIR